MGISLDQSYASGQKIWAYVDSKQNIQFEQNHFFSRIVRAFCSLTGWRSYDLAKVLPAMQKMPSTSQQQSNINFVLEKLVKRSGLSASDLEVLKSLSSSSVPPEKARNFIEKSIGNKALNQAVLTLRSQLKDDSLVDRKMLQTIATFSHKTKSLENLDRAVEKVKHIQPMLRKKGMVGTLSPEQKLTHRDLIVIEDMSKLVPILQKFKKMGLYQSKEQPLGALASKIHRVSNFTNQVHNIAERQAPHAKSGTLIFYDIHNYAAKRNFWGGLFDTVVFKYLFRTPIFHASVGYRNEKKQDVEADIWATFREGRRSLYSRTFKTMEFNLEKLTGNDQNRKKLEQLYGKNWQQALETKYNRLLRSYFKHHEPYKNLHNPASRRFLVGVGLRWNPFKKDLAQRAQFNQKQSVCSEFATKSMMQCFIQLQEAVGTDWAKSKRFPKDQEAPQLDHPIRDYRRLHRVTPHEMTRRLVETGFATEAKRPSIIEDLITFHDYDLKKS